MSGVQSPCSHRDMFHLAPGTGPGHLDAGEQGRLPGQGAHRLCHGAGAPGRAAKSTQPRLPLPGGGQLWTHCPLSAQVAPALNLLGEASCHPDPRATWKTALPAKSDLHLDPNTILQTQDHLSQDYEDLRALAEVTLSVGEMVNRHLPGSWDSTPVTGLLPALGELLSQPADIRQTVK